MVAKENGRNCRLPDGSFFFYFPSFFGEGMGLRLRGATTEVLGRVANRGSEVEMLARSEGSGRVAQSSLGF